MNEAKRRYRKRAAHKNTHRASRKPFNLPTALLSVGGLGFMRPAPGTWGSLPPAVLAFVLLAAGAGTWALTAVMALLLLASSFVCVRFGVYSEQRFRRKDAAEVVADETAGCSLVFLALPVALSREASVVGAESPQGVFDAFLNAALVAALGFVLFRVADIIKPPPARRLEKLPHGWGVLIDDLMAGVYALIAMQLLTRLLF